MKKIKTISAIDKHTIATYEVALQKIEEDYVNRVHRLNKSELGQEYARAIDRELNLIPQANASMNKEVIDYSKAKKVVKTKKSK